MMMVTEDKLDIDIQTDMGSKIKELDNYFVLHKTDNKVDILDPAEVTFKEFNESKMMKYSTEKTFNRIKDIISDFNSYPSEVEYNKSLLNFNILGIDIGLYSSTLVIDDNDSVELYRANNMSVADLNTYNLDDVYILSSGLLYIFFERVEDKL